MSAMEVILLERVEKLGQMGEVVRVKPGYARNFLLPQKKALRATAENKERFEKQRSQLEAVNLKLKGEAESVAKKMDNVSVVLVRQAGETGQLYGSVSARDIADAVTAAGFTVEHRQIRIDRPIKTLGLVQTRVMLHPEVAVTVTVNVAKSEEEAERQAKGDEPPAAEEIFEAPPAAAEAAPEAAAESAGEEKPKKAKKAKSAADEAAPVDLPAADKPNTKRSKGKKKSRDEYEDDED
jgi:large subunit ribosomal protein L9